MKLEDVAISAIKANRDAWFFEERAVDLAGDVVRLKMENARLRAAMRAAITLLTWHERRAK